VFVNGKRQRKNTTDGWHFNIQWKDGTTSWEPLKRLKESNPLEVAEYTVANKIASEPVFCWWIPFTLQRWDRIIVVVNKRYLLRTHKFGICVAKTVDEALQIDRESGTTHWKDARGRHNMLPVAIQ
jgi:hypothetical protein